MSVNCREPKRQRNTTGLSTYSFARIIINLSTVGELQRTTPLPAQPWPEVVQGPRYSYITSFRHNHQ